VIGEPSEGEGGKKGKKKVGGGGRGWKGERGHSMTRARKKGGTIITSPGYRKRSVGVRAVKLDSRQFWRTSVCVTSTLPGERVGGSPEGHHRRVRNEEN